MKITRFSNKLLTLASLLILFFSSHAHATKSYTPSQVFAGIEHADHLLDKLLAKKGISNIQVPISRETSVKPMHVYELHVSVLDELYTYAINNNRRPPPVAISTPIKYNPTDVYYLTRLISDYVKDLYRDSSGDEDSSAKRHKNKTPVEVYQKIFSLYYKLNRLNGRTKVSPSDVYAHIYRAKEDLQNSLLTLSKRMSDSEEEKKRLLVTATYGMNTDGSTLSDFEKEKNPADVMQIALDVREKLNQLRKKNKLSEIKQPSLSQYEKVKPIDVFLQTQFIIAELNLLKIPMNILSITNRAKPATGKTPSDVYQEMKHINYMLDRLLRVM